MHAWGGGGDCKISKREKKNKKKEGTERLWGWGYNKHGGRR
jgi:hypothetical protein